MLNPLFLKRLLLDLAPLIAFYTIQHFLGFQIAIVASIALVVALIISKVRQRIALGKFFMFSSLMVVVFGALDLCLNQLTFFRYEAAASNIVSAIYFATTLLGQDPILLELSGRKFEGRPITPLTIKIFKILTAAWVIYFLAKATIYTWSATQWTLEQNLAFRSTVGTISLYAMIGLTIIAGKYLGKLLTGTSARESGPTTNA